MSDAVARSGQEQTRGGSRALSIVAHPLHAAVLRAHVDRPLRPGELEDAMGWAAPSSLRRAVGRLCDLGALAWLGRTGGIQGKTELTGAGRELLTVAGSLERWLQEAPDGPLSLDDSAAHGVVRVLTAGWDAAMVTKLAERPHALPELSEAISGVSDQSLKRRLGKLRSTGLVAPIGSGRSVPYTATDWLRRAVIPLVVASWWELRHEPGDEPPPRIEVEAALLLALPLVELPANASGPCTLATLIPADMSEAAEPELTGVAVEVDRGRVASARLNGGSDPGTWALGAVDEWLDAVVNGRDNTLRLGGERPGLAQAVVKSIHAALFRELEVTTW